MTITTIIAAACKCCEVTPAELCSLGRTDDIRLARQIVAFIARREGHCYTAIAAAMGRTHQSRWPAPTDGTMLAAVEARLAAVREEPIRLKVKYSMSPSEMLHLLEVSDEHRKAAAIWVSDRLRLRYDPTRLQPAERPGSGEVRT